MSRKSIPLLCYWDGKISHGLQGITFEDATPLAIKVNRGVKHSELIGKIYALIGIDCEKYELKIICRYLANGKYVPLLIVNDEMVDIMLDMTKEKGINCVELYIEKSYVFGESPFSEGEKPTTIRDPLHVRLHVQAQDGRLIVYTMKRETPLRKIMTTFCEKELGSKAKCYFLFSGLRLEEDLTPNEYHMEDGAGIDVFCIRPVISVCLWTLL